MSTRTKQACLQLLMVAFQATLITMSSSAGLQYNFYSSSCPNAEQTVRNGMIDADPTMPAAFLRLLFHDCFVMGCDASILLDPTKANGQPEKTAIPLRGYEAVNKIKAAVEDVCPGTVSRADVLAFAPRDSVARSAGFTFPIPAGRRDGTVSSAFSVFSGIPSPFFNAQQLIDSFAAKNLSVDDLVALSGAHSIGVAHCSAFASRLRPTVDPSLDPAQLNATCPGGGARHAEKPVLPERAGRAGAAHLGRGAADPGRHGGEGERERGRRDGVDGAVCGGDGENGRHRGAHGGSGGGQDSGGSATSPTAKMTFSHKHGMAGLESKIFFYF
ncbi:hypothetical protein PVAP13_5NG210181 [Panicum virgatum]|uniref:Peroxidase n=1 Tax=Panicum virgatum TaxID=38727 RepID=A0A8T0RS44_PANVG|nr:hypothetical protein PVAP13_5NG210181 [Panicum virgatum]